MIAPFEMACRSLRDVRLWIWKLICKAPTGQHVYRFDISLRVRRHKPTIEDVQGVGLCHSGR